MRHFIIETADGNTIFGVYSGETEQDACEECASDAGTNDASGLVGYPLDSISGRSAIRTAKTIDSLTGGGPAPKGARWSGVQLVKAADPTEGERRGLSYSEAEDICAAEDPSLVRLERA